MLKAIITGLGVLDALGTLIGGIWLLVSWVTGTQPPPTLVEFWTGLWQFGLFLLAVAAVVGVAFLRVVYQSIRQPSYF